MDDSYRTPCWQFKKSLFDRMSWLWTICSRTLKLMIASREIGMLLVARDLSPALKMGVTLEVFHGTVP